MKNEKKVKLLHKYIGFHNTVEVCKSESFDKDFAKDKCEDLLLDYFHNLQQGMTVFPLKYYNGEVAYIGSENIKESK